MLFGIAFVVVTAGLVIGLVRREAQTSGDASMRGAAPSPVSVTPRRPAMRGVAVPRRLVEPLADPVADLSPLATIPPEERARVEGILRRAPDLTAQELRVLEKASYAHPTAAALLQATVRATNPSYTFTGA